MDELMLDGNAVGGLLQEVFAAEMTTAIGTCGDCGAAGPVGAAHLYRGAGIVLRCPHCDNADSRGIVPYRTLVTSAARIAVEFTKSGGSPSRYSRLEDPPLRWPRPTLRARACRRDEPSADPSPMRPRVARSVRPTGSL
jgi:hypothetical protein